MALWPTGQPGDPHLPSFRFSLQPESGRERGGPSCYPSVILTSDEVVHEGGGHAENAHQQVADSQVEDEHVGDGAHVPVLEHDEADEGVAHHAEEEDEHIGRNEHGCHWGGVLVVGGEGEVDGQGRLGVTPVLTQGPAAIGRLGGLV